jgi:hypothetical protein
LPRLRDKRLALRLIWRLGDLLASELSSSRGRDFTIGCAEYRALYRRVAAGSRLRDLTTMALQRFSSRTVETPRWSMEIVDSEKPVIRMRVKGS